jgi:hypothetical protein
MKKKEFIVLLLGIISLLIPQLHMFLNNHPVNKVDLILFADKMQDVQWYVKHMGDYISTLILYVIILKLLPQKLKILGMLLLAGGVLDIVNYWLFYHQFDWSYKSLIIIIILYIITNEKRNNNRSSN